MADIGVLSLQIHSESTQAENSLRRLEGALLAVKKAVNGSGLGKFANSIERIKKAASFETIGNLHALAAALNQVKRSCDFTIPNISGLNKIKTVLDGMNRGATATRETQESLNQMAEGFSSVGASVDTVSGKVAGFIGEVNKASDVMGNFKFDQFKAAFNEWSKMRSQFTLGPGKETALSTGMTSGWEEWKRGAIEAEGTVTEATETINADLQGTQAQIKMLVDESEKWVTVLDAATGEFKKVHIDDYGKPDESIASTIQVIAGEIELLGNSSGETESRLDHLLQKLAILREEVDSGKSITGKELNEKQIVNYKIQIDNLIDKIERLRSVEDNMREYGAEMVENLTNNYSQIELETMKLEGLKRALAEDINANKVDTEQIAERIMKIQNLTARIEELKQKEEEEAAALKQIASLRESIGSLQNEFSSKMAGGELDVAGVRDYQTRISELMGQLEELQGKQERLGSSAGMDITNDKARQMAESFMETNSQLDLLKQRADEIKIAMGRGLLNGDLDTKGLAKLYTEYDKVTASIKRAEGEAYGLKDAFAGMKSAVSDLFDPLTKLGKQFVNIAKRMAIRYIIRMFVQGMKEGVENMYVWSKAMETDFAPAMDKAATAILDLKNSLGAMASEALMAILPVLDEIIDGVIEVINFFNQMFAAMQGKGTWKEYVRGSAAAKAFDDTTKSAKGTQKAIKDLLADWDELNIIQSESSGSGSGSSLTYDKDKNGEYRDSPISGFAQTIASIANFFGGIAGIAAGVAGIWLLKKGDAAFMKYYQDHWPKPEKPSGGATTQQEIKEAADNAAKDVVSNVKDKIVDAVKENTEATQQMVKAEHEVQKLDAAKEIAQMTNDKLDGMAQLRLGNEQSYIGMTMEQFTAQNPLLAGNRLGLKIDAAKEVGSRMLPNKVDTINLMSGVDTISVDTAKVIENSGTQVNVEATRANVPALESVEDVLKGTDIDWDYTFGDGKDHNNPFGSYVGRHIDHEPHQSYPIPEYPKNWDTTPINATVGAVESGARLLEETASATANLTAATEAVNESAPLLQEAAQAVEDASHATPGLLPSGSVFAEAYEIPDVGMSGTSTVKGAYVDGVYYFFRPEDAEKYGIGNLDWHYAGNGSFALFPEGEQVAGAASKLDGTKWAIENWAAQHAQEGMMALIAAEFIGQYGKGKKEQRKAYSEYYGEEYDELSGAKKALVQQGYSPEVADALVEATKGAWKESLPGIFRWLPDFAENAISLVENGLVTAGEATELVENAFDLGDAAGGILLNSIFFPDSGSVEKGIKQAIENPITQWVIDAVRDVFSGPDTPGKAEVDQAGKTYYDYYQQAFDMFEELTKDYDAATEEKFQSWIQQYAEESGKSPTLEKIYEWAINHRPYGVGQDIGNELQQTLDTLTWYRDEYYRLIQLYQEGTNERYEYNEPSTSGNLWYPNMRGASTQFVGGGGRGYNPYNSEAAEVDMANATEKGTKAANSDLEDNTSETNRLLRQLLQKNWQINLFPTSGWGLFNRRSNEAAEAVTGNNP